MTDDEFDAALIKAAFTHAGLSGWHNLSPAAAVREGGLDLGRARQRFPTNYHILRGFVAASDRYALTGALAEGPTRDRLFDTLMRRFDFLQLHRLGVKALLNAVLLDPPLALFLVRANINSMGWYLEAAGVPASGLLGEATKRALALVYAAGVRAWVDDESMDLTHTMAALDTALNRAESLAERFYPSFNAASASEDAPFNPPAPPSAPDDPSRAE